MVDYAADLNAGQRAAVLAPDGPLQIVAGAGTGKTRVLTYRIAHLVVNRGVPPECVLAVTFTNKAAAELRARLVRLMGAAARRAWVGTFHALAARLLRRHAERIGHPRDFVIYDEDDQRTLARRVLKERAEWLQAQGLPEVTPAELLWTLDRVKNAGALPSPREIAARSIDVPAHFVALMQIYQARLHAAGAMDFGDLIVLSRVLLAEHSDVRETYATRFRHILVDEFQDTNPAQYEWLRLLAGRADGVCVVGDEDQGIYSWRGATLRNFRAFAGDFPGTQVVVLDRNYRSTQPILEVAGAVIAHNTRRQPKRLVTDVVEGAPPVLCGAATERDEAEWVCRRIARLRATEGLRFGDIAVLYRTNAQSRALEEALRTHGWAGHYVVVGSTSFFDRREVKDVVAWLRLLVNPSSDVDLLRVINVPPRHIGATTVAALDADRAKAGGSLWDAVLRAEDNPHLSQRARRHVGAFRALVGELRATLAQVPVYEAVDAVILRTGYDRWLEEHDEGEGPDRVANLSELVNIARNYHDEAAEDPEQTPGVSGFLERMSLVQAGDEKGDAEGGVADAVQLMTLHVAKGKEYPAVFITGLEEGLVPHRRSTSGEDLEEERRLFYVGITRAQKCLFMSFAEQRQVFGDYTIVSKSRFLCEIPDECLTLEGLAGAASWRDARATDAWGAPMPRRAKGSRRVERDDGSVIEYGDDDEVRGDTEAARKANVAPGVRVRHVTFGEGCVRDVEPRNGRVYLTIEFGTVGRKTIAANYVEVMR